MANSIKIEELPDEVKDQVIEYAEFLLKKYKYKKKESNWLERIDRGSSIYEMGSTTIEKMREEEKW